MRVKGRGGGNESGQVRETEKRRGQERERGREGEGEKGESWSEVIGGGREESKLLLKHEQAQTAYRPRVNKNYASSNIPYISMYRQMFSGGLLYHAHTHTTPDPHMCVVLGLCVCVSVCL